MFKANFSNKKKRFIVYLSPKKINILHYDYGMKFDFLIHWILFSYPINKSQQ